jgi:oxygen-dependent protoporphyrinogen oxidase
LATRLGEDVLTGCDRIALASANSSYEDGRFNIDVERSGTLEQISCENVIIAVPSRAAGSLVGGLSVQLKDLLAEIEHPPLAIAYLGYSRSAIQTPIDGFGFLVAPTEGLKILGCVWNSSLFGDRAPRDKVLMTVFMGGALTPTIAGLGDDELVSIAHGELQRILGISTEPEVVDITRYDRSIPQYNLGHAARVRRIEELANQIPGLRLIGNYLHGVSTGDCVKSADLVAREIASSSK